MLRNFYYSVIGVIFWISLSSFIQATTLCQINADGSQSCSSTDTTVNGTPIFTSTQLTDTSFQTPSPNNTTDLATVGTVDPINISSVPELGSSTTSESKTIDIYVTEKIPGANCTCVNVNDAITDSKDVVTNSQSTGDNCGDPKTRRYVCKVDKGLVAFQGVFQSIVRWFVYISMLLGVVAIIGVGILWAWGSDSEEYAKKAKGWAMNIVIGLILLFTFRYILGFLAPWIFQ